MGIPATTRQLTGLAPKGSTICATEESTKPCLAPHQGYHIAGTFSRTGPRNRSARRISHKKSSALRLQLARGGSVFQHLTAGVSLQRIARRGSARTRPSVPTSSIISVRHNTAQHLYTFSTGAPATQRFPQYPVAGSKSLYARDGSGRSAPSKKPCNNNHRDPLKIVSLIA